MQVTGKINYIEWPVRDIEASKAFFAKAFEWTFIDYGPDYCAIENAGIDAGFYKSDKSATTEAGSVLVVLYSENLEATLQGVKECQATITKDIFSFPGGRRFQFLDPCGNEFAVWSDVI